jgi:hypothetical protein
MWPIRIFYAGGVFKRGGGRETQEIAVLRLKIRLRSVPEQAWAVQRLKRLDLSMQDLVAADGIEPSTYGL